jgi:hypothetical protein
MEGCKTSFCSSKFPWVRDRISSKFIENMVTCPQNFSPTLSYKPSDEVSRPYFAFVPSCTAFLSTDVALNVIALKIKQGRPGTLTQQLGAFA